MERVTTHRDDGVAVRLDDDWIEVAGAALEAGGSSEATLADLASGRRYSVQFWDANATKALHVGHCAISPAGNALAAALAQAGGQVERRSLISDAGRSMGEAMAGVLGEGGEARWPAGDEKSDHFVGACYADYVASSGAGVAVAVEHPEDSLTRELAMHGDAADELLARVLSGEQEALELWYKTRAWVIGGQRKTLARLGVAFDRVYFESDFLQEAAQLTSAGLRDGRLRRREDGVVVYATGMEDFAEFPLVRADGLPTQHMRALAYWTAAPKTDHTTSVQVCGTEWVSHVTCRRQLMRELLAEQPARNGNGCIHPTHDIFNGMVSRQKRALASSEGALLIDELIDWLDAQIDRDPARRLVRSEHPHPERVAAQVALGFFLPHPVAPRIDFEPDRLLAERESLGWELARAQAYRESAPRLAQRPAPQTATTASRWCSRSSIAATCVWQWRAWTCARWRTTCATSVAGTWSGNAESTYREWCRRCSSAAPAASDWRRDEPERRRDQARRGCPMRTLLVDNYDSYTYNVFHLLAAASGEEPIVVRNDVVTWRALSRFRFDAIVLSPGPGRPERWHDFGVCADILRSGEVPVLGICLGHQGLGMALEGMVASAPCPMHGRLSRVRHVADGLFHGLAQDFTAVRYHSLAVTGPLGPRRSRDRVDRGRSGDGGRTPPSPDVGGAVSPGVDCHRARAGAGGELLRARSPLSPRQATRRYPRSQTLLARLRVPVPYLPPKATTRRQRAPCACARWPANRRQSSCSSGCSVPAPTLSGSTARTPPPSSPAVPTLGPPRGRGGACSNTTCTGVS